MKLDKQNVEDLLELTPFQEGLLVHHLGSTEPSPQYIEQLYLKIEGASIDPELFKTVWQSITDTNEILRTIFRWEGLKKPVIAVLKKHDVQVEVIDLSNLSAPAQQEAVTQRRKDDIKRGFDLREVPFRVCLILLNEKSSVLLVSNHHILYDGWSTGILLREFSEAYEAISDGNEIQFGDKAKYKEYILKWKKEQNEQEDGFWKSYLQAYDGKSTIPFRNTNAIEVADTQKHIFDLNEGLVKQVSDLAKERRTTSATILYTAWALLLQQYNENQNVTFGTTVSTRPNNVKGIENTVGLFINTLPLVVENTNINSILQLIGQVQQNLTERSPYEMSSLTKIGEYAEVTGELFDSIVVIENYPLDQSLTEQTSKLEITDHYMDYLTHYPLSVVISLYEKIQVTFTYNRGAFDPTALAQIQMYFERILAFMSEQSEAPTGQLSKHLVNDSAILPESLAIGSPLDLNGKMPIHLFEEQVKFNADATAIRSEGTYLSYKEVDEKAAAVATALQEKGVKVGDTVLLYFDNSAEVVIAMLAVLKLRAIFLPVSPDTPDERVKFIIEDSNASMVLTDLKLLSKANYLRLKQEVFCVSLEALEPATFTSQTPEPEDVAYIIYTSGTTGNPKGVMIQNSNLGNYIQSAQVYYGQEEKVVFPLFTSPAFDLTLTSIFTPITTGGMLIVYQSDKKDFLIQDVYAHNKVDVIKLTPSHLRLLVEKVKGEKKKLGFKSSIKRFIVGGEDFKSELAKEVHQLFEGKVELYNEYGPTEGTIGCMIHRYDPEQDIRKSVPVGKPSFNNEVWVLDEELNSVVLGQTGEMYLGGFGLAQGYFNNTELTDARFIQHAEKGRLYKTGDLARWLPDGNLEFLGRNDKQVKLSGYRIELDEIEDRLLSFGKYEVKEDDFDIKIATEKLKELHRCNECLLPENYPGIDFDDEGTCNICNEFKKYRQEIENYFKSEADFDTVAAEMKSNSEEYDCLLLYSGGKDSTYVLYKLIDYGLKVMTYTFDNGYISKTAFKNIEATTNKLGITHHTISSENMNRVFAESLRESNSSCHGCWHAINTFGIQLANKYNIDYIVSGLSRGQIYDMRLEGIYEAKIFEQDDVEKQLAVFRNQFHSKDNKYSRLLKVSVDDKIGGIQFIDFFRFFNTPVKEIKSYLLSKGWIQPKDTGFCSSNCLINDIGIYTHIKEKGFNFYTAPLSWDVRLQQATREDTMEEILAFGSTEKYVKKVLREIEYADAFKIDEAIVLKEEQEGRESLVAYIVSNIEPNISQLRSHLRKELPEYMIPSHFVQLDEIPLTGNGKIDQAALPKIAQTRPKISGNLVLPTSAIEERIAKICKEALKLEVIGIHDNLFDLGAKSFDLTKIASKLSIAFDTKVNVITLFEKSTVHELATLVNELTSKQKAKPETPTNKPQQNKLGQRRKMLSNRT